jgi:hypothetical protein
VGNHQKPATTASVLADSNQNTNLEHYLKKNLFDILTCHILFSYISYYGDAHRLSVSLSQVQSPGMDLHNKTCLCCSKFRPCICNIYIMLVHNQAVKFIKIWIKSLLC